MPAILQQGRCTFFSLRKDQDEDSDEDDARSDQDVEYGPKMLADLIEDSSTIFMTSNA
jgi:hypothetical protein